METASNNCMMTWTSAALAIWSAVKAAGKADLELVDVMGYSGHAFRININPDNVDIAGPTGYSWEKFFALGLANLGFHSSYVRSANLTPPTPDELIRGLSLAQKSIDRGIPAISWDLFIPEFGVLYGYNDESKELHGKDPQMDGTLPYEKLGRGRVGEMFVMALEEEIPVTPLSMLRGALEIAIDHAFRREHEHEKPGYQNGLAGYDAWIAAFEQGHVSEIGHAYNLAVVCDAREHAAQFLLSAANRLEQEGIGGNDAVLIAREAAGYYTKVREELGALLPLFPFPQGGTPNDPAISQQVIAVLRSVREAEASGVAALKRLLAVLPQAMP